jgi:hypothetical protein
MIIGGIEMVVMSCKETVEPIQQATYIYENKLAIPIVFKLTDSSRKISWEANIGSGDSLIFNIQGNPGANPFSGTESEKRTGDLVIINFGNGKCTKYSRDLSSGTFDGTGVFKKANYNNYSLDIVNSEKYRLKYIISEKDLTVAQQCN